MFMKASWPMHYFEQMHDWVIDLRVLGHILGDSFCIVYNSTPLKPDMTMSNEPGYYVNGQLEVANHSHHYLCLCKCDFMLSESFSSKFNCIRQEMAKKNAVAMAVTLLDGVDLAVLFIDESQMDDSIKAYLGQSVGIQLYREFIPYLRQFTADLLAKRRGNKMNLAIVKALSEEIVTLVASPMATLNGCDVSTRMRTYNKFLDVTADMCFDVSGNCSTHSLPP
ncbi:hypothetical protein SCLCIDRAFT_10642 [Scleroderma citrinum Foug A]|uniref:Uncharacterized protein n=1 Tax=Scleroderma citrinum Foug A TaxID=1036808 RepID=A0A0C3D7V8_9AGAM|nr:hypothetical protein SCLCIDRAFT_10642 [Scleroderma citrinum Foug A]